ncbi:hypothetical protein FIBSPDRAFT_965845 [Athelia psychrophila]|uniref:Uncharacterized protein n=1 Tax=Athelia psychrophila TaxID=1759441 RepID=A0A167XFV0_9AGAM|nr:hypothetical protein FIBSPDRAFT_965845 [Fibularhizoctonia sp. CBS 109695]
MTRRITSSTVSRYDPTREQSSSTSLADTQDPPLLKPHVFQRRHLWSNDENNPGEVISQKRRKQLSHRGKHYTVTVPCMILINGKNHTQFAGSWTILNRYDIARVSGLAAAYRLGADYTFNNHAEASGCSHCMWMQVMGRGCERTTERDSALEVLV